MVTLDVSGNLVVVLYSLPIIIMTPGIQIVSYIFKDATIRKVSDESCISNKGAVILTRLAPSLCSVI